MGSTNGDTVGTEIIGYVEPWITTPGETVEVKVSSTDPSYTHRLVRLVEGFKGKGKPLATDEVIAEVAPGQHSNGRYQAAHPGSYGLVEGWKDVTVSADDEVSVHFYAQPYLLEHGGVQTLLSCLDVHRGDGFAVVLKDAKLQFWVGVGASKVQVVQSNVEVNRWRWLEIQLTFSRGGLTSRVQQLNRLAEPAPKAEELATRLDSPLVLGSSSLLFAAGLFENAQTQSQIPASFFNGRLDSPTFEIVGRQPRILAKYDFRQDISGDSLVDVSNNGLHGVLINAPMRAAKGYNWDGSQVDWTKDSSQYGAIHFHDDDLDDAAWETDFRLTVPASCRSGAYAVELTTSNGFRDLVTFFVHPKPTSKADVAIVLPTFTYLAYANEHMFDQTKSSAMTVSGGVQIQEDNVDYQKMVRRSDLGLSVYDVHSDGSGCIFTSSKRPILNLRPGYEHWALHRPRELSADLLMVGFLEQSGVSYDVVTDHYLQFEGSDLASRYSTLVTGGHPEYCSLQILDSYSAFARAGGSIMYLGGNGFYWTTQTSAERPHRVEVRKGDQGCRSITIAAGERIHSTDGGHGGLWRSRGRAPNYLFGIGCCAFGTGLGKPYVQNKEHAHQDIYAKVFAGIKPDELIGEHGYGGGASGDEIDRLDYALGTPTNCIILATSQQHDETFGLFNEEQMFPMVDTLGPQCDRVRSDMTFYEASGGGGVFSTGSINWYSSLGWNNYQNNVATVTGNVLREFVERGRARK